MDVYGTAMFQCNGNVCVCVVNEDWIWEGIRDKIVSQKKTLLYCELKF